MNIRTLFSQLLFWLSLAASVASAVFLQQYFTSNSLQDWVLETYKLKNDQVPEQFFQLAIIQSGVVIFAYLISLQQNIRRRPFIGITIGAFSVGFTAGFAGHALLENITVVTWLSGVGGGVVSASFLLGFEFFNRWLWQSLVNRLDKKNQGGAALFVSRLALLWRPGQDALLCSVSIELFRRGQRGEISKRLRTYYEQGERKPELLEVLCQLANEENQKAEFLEYLKALYVQFPADAQLRDAYTDELLEQKYFAEALIILDEYGVDETSIDALEKHAVLLLEAGRLQDAVGVARKLAREEGIPMRRSDAVLRRVLAEDEKHLEAINMLADHAKRMARKDQQIRWLDQSYMLDPSQKKRGQDLLELLQQAEMTRRMEDILSVMVEEFPEDLEFRLQFGQVLHSNGKTEEAINVLHPLCRKQRATAAHFTFLAKLLYERKSLKEAREVVVLALEKSPTEEESELLQGLLKKIEKAEFTDELADKLERCKENPHNLPLSMDCLQRLISSQHLDRAIAQGDFILRFHPQSRSQVIDCIKTTFNEIPEGGYALLSYLADLQVAEGLYDDALSTIRLMADRTSINREAAIREGAQKILRRSPHHLKTLRTVGNMYREMGQFTEMIHSYSLYLSNGGEETEEIDRALAQAYLSLDDYSSARRFIHQILQSYTNTDKAKEQNLELLRKAIPSAIADSQAVDAAEYMQKIELLDPQNKGNRSLKMRVDEALGEQRFEFLKREVEAGKGDKNTLEELGDLRLEAKDFNNAITYYQRAARQSEVNRIAQAKLAYAFAKKRMFDLASETLLDLKLSLDDDSEELDQLMGWLYKTGEVLEEAHMFNSASKLFKQLMKVDAGYRDVIQKVEKLGAK
ncbi:MAG: hypothetical protein ACFCU1_09310 [Sumerlaeia bacterium]